VASPRQPTAPGGRESGGPETGGPETPGAAPGGRRVRVGVVGDSIGQPCGVRDHATLLAGALELQGMSCSLHWLSKSGGSLRASGAELRTWTRTLADELARERPDALLLHYSVFALSHRGVPVFVRPVLSVLRELRLPLVTFMHEFAYPWRLGGLRGVAWAATQRAVLIDAMRASSAVVVSAEPRAGWLRSRLWLPGRPISVAPVFSNLPPAGEAAGPVVADRLGLFGYAHEGVDAETVLDALALLRERGSPCRLVLLGAPGRDSSAGSRWERGAAQRGLAGALSFSGPLPAQALSDRLSSCVALLFAERGGPTSRKTTLAASLSSGRPVVALDGRNSWTELVRSQAALIARPDAASLASAIAGLLADEAARERQGELGRVFASAQMSVERSADVVARALVDSIERAGR
jgi:glycosyltransferase involved in cell wall biosynthesis